MKKKAHYPEKDCPHCGGKGDYEAADETVYICGYCGGYGSINASKTPNQPNPKHRNNFTALTSTGPINYQL